jgi:hypothetical protein
MFIEITSEVQVFCEGKSVQKEESCLEGNQMTRDRENYIKEKFNIKTG